MVATNWTYPLFVSFVSNADVLAEIQTLVEKHRGEMHAAPSQLE